MNSGAKAAIAVIGIIVALFIAGIIGLVVLGALIFGTTKVNIQTNTPVPIVSEVVPGQTVQPGDVILEIDGEKVTMPEISTPALNSGGGELIFEVNGENLKITPNTND
ncbi:MAG: hypothetical protein ACKVH8_17205 [Pirellulales bacterium]